MEDSLLPGDRKPCLLFSGVAEYVASGSLLYLGRRLIRSVLKISVHNEIIMTYNIRVLG